jgi:hypothetical protein
VTLGLRVSLPTRTGCRWLVGPRSRGGTARAGGPRPSVVRLDQGGHRTANILTIVATCIAHDVNPRAYLHLATKLIVHGWPRSKLRELLPDRMLVSHPELFVGEPAAPLPALQPA